MKKIFSILLSVAFITSCNNKDKRSKTITTSATTHLTEASLYNPDSIKVALNFPAVEQEMAKKKFLEAIELYKNKKQIAQGITTFKSSLFIYPSEKTYYELGSALADNKDYDESLKAFHIAEQMNYSPLANVLYKIASVYALMPPKYSKEDAFTNLNDSIALHFMEVALQMGYSKPADFLHDKAFDSLKINSNWIFKNVYNTAMSGNKDPQKLAWESYKNEFKEMTLPVTINTVWVYDQKYENAIAYDFEKFVPEMRTGKFSREVENEYFYVGRIKEDSLYTALLYAGKNMWITDGRGYTPIYFYLVTYSPQGKILDKMEVGGQKSFTDNFKTLSLKENLTMEVKSFKNIYEKDPEKDGYEKNKVIKSDLVSTNYYKINSKGKFERTERMLAMEVR